MKSYIPVLLIVCVIVFQGMSTCSLHYNPEDWPRQECISHFDLPEDGELVCVPYEFLQPVIFEAGVYAYTDFIHHGGLFSTTGRIVTRNRSDMSISSDGGIRLGVDDCIKWECTTELTGGDICSMMCADGFHKMLMMEY